MKKSEFLSKLQAAMGAYNHERRHEHLRFQGETSKGPEGWAKEYGIYCGETQGVDEVVNAISNLHVLSSNSNYHSALKTMEMVEVAWEYYEEQRWALQSQGTQGSPSAIDDPGPNVRAQMTNRRT